MKHFPLPRLPRVVWMARLMLPFVNGVKSSSSLCWQPLSQHNSAQFERWCFCSAQPRDSMGSKAIQVNKSFAFSTRFPSGFSSITADGGQLDWLDIRFLFYLRIFSFAFWKVLFTLFFHFHLHLPKIRDGIDLANQTTRKIQELRNKTDRVACCEVSLSLSASLCNVICGLNTPRENLIRSKVPILMYQHWTYIWRKFVEWVRSMSIFNGKPLSQRSPHLNVSDFCLGHAESFHFGSVNFFWID